MNRTTSWTTCTGINIRRLVGSLLIDVWDGPGVEVEVTAGDGARLDEIGVRADGNVLVVEDTGAAAAGSSSSSISISQSSVGSIQITGGSGVVVINGRRVDLDSMGPAKSAAAVVKLKVPWGASEFIVHEVIGGPVTIGDVKTDVELNVLADADVTCGRVHSAEVSIVGSGDVTIADVRGHLTVAVAGSGDVHVKGGAVETLSVSVTGSGDVRVRAPSSNASITLTGSGDIRVGPVKGKQRVRQTGTGDVTVDT
jgi:hypothetical protein